MNRVQELFHAAIERCPPAEWDAFLVQGCGADEALRRYVAQLLKFHEASPNQETPRSEEGRSTAAYRANGQEIENVGPYKLLERLGEGGMGTVYLAEQTTPVRRRVAVKIVKEGMDSKSVLSRFEAERQALAVMDHPNIAKVFDGGRTDHGRPYFVMEYVKGVPITQYCDDARLSVRDRLELLVPVCQAVQHAHQKGIIHRDLKPSNILVCLYDGRPVPKVIDFGLAKALHQDRTEHTCHTAHGTMLGTPLYMSPEQAEFNNLDIDTRSDIYALGVILYELLTGTTPLEKQRFKEAAWQEMLRLIKEEEPPKPSTRLSSIDKLPSVAAQRQLEPAKLSRLIRGELDWIVMKCLEKDRGRRYETATGLAGDIQHYLSHQPVTAGPPSASYRLKKFLRRHRGPVIAASLVVLTLLAGIVGTTVGMWRAEQMREAAEQAKANETARADAEKKAKNVAQRRLVQIEKGVELFAGLLRGLNPRAAEEGGPPLYDQLRQKAAKAADELVGEAIGDPESMARLQLLLGRTLRELGDRPKAVEVMERARATRAAQLGADHPDTIAAMNDLAVACLDADRLPEAIVLLKQVRDHLIVRQGIDHPDTLTVSHNLAGAYRVTGDLSQAITLHQQVRDAWLKKEGPEHRSTLTAMEGLSTAYRSAGRLTEAIALMEQVRDGMVKRMGPDHLDTLTTLTNLADAYYSAKRYSEAISLYERARDGFVSTLGADHPDALVTQGSLGGAYRAAGKVNEAIALLEKARDASLKKLGAEHLTTLTILNGLALAYQDARRLAEALPIAELVRDGYVKKLGSSHPQTLSTLFNLATLYRASGRLPDATTVLEQAASGLERLGYQHEHAEKILRATYRAHEQQKQFDRAEPWRRNQAALVKAKSGAETLAYADELAGLGMNLVVQKKGAEGEVILREALAIREKKEPEASTTFVTKSQLGVALVIQKKYDQAEPLLLAGYEGIKKRRHSIPPESKQRQVDALNRLIRFYTETNNPVELKKWQVEKQQVLAEQAKGNTPEDATVRPPKGPKSVDR